MVTAKSKQAELIATVGRRKRAVARVRLLPGTGKFIVNEKEVKNLHPAIVELFELVGLSNKLDITVKVLGGGAMGQIGAIRHGIARAIVKMDQENRKTLKKAGFLTRDPREKERKKPGLKRARRAPQWSKR